MKSDSPWSAWRAALDMPPGLVNFNAGTCSPIATTVAERLTELTRAISREPVEMLFRQAPARIEAGRIALAMRLGADPRDLLLFSNASYGVNTVLRSIPFKAGDELLTTDQEYDQYFPLLARIERETGARVVRVPIPLADQAPQYSPSDVVSAFKERLTPRTVALFFSHVTSATGLVLPAKALVALARAHGALACIDGAHAPGLISLDLASIDADFYAANVHKWLMGAAGSAFLHVRRSSRQHLVPLMTMGGFDYPEAKADTPYHPNGPTHWIHSHEYQGTRNLAPLMVLDDVITFHDQLEAAGVRQRMTTLAARARVELQDAGLTIASHAHAELATPLIACRVPPQGAGIDKGKAWMAVRREHQLEVAFPRLADGTQLLRVCTAWFNTEDEITWLGELLRTLDWSKWRA